MVSPFEYLADEYDRWFDEAGKLLFEIEVCALKSVLQGLPKPWLEIGVGSGRFAEALGIEIGLDPSYRILELARTRGVAAVQGKGENIPFMKESFGSLFMLVTICFLESPLAVLRETHRVLRPGGKLVLGLVTADSPWGIAYQRKKQENHRFYRYATFYKYSELVRMVENAGFMLERTVSTLFQKPGDVRHRGTPLEGYYPEAGFTILVAGKLPVKDGGQC